MPQTTETAFTDLYLQLAPASGSACVHLWVRDGQVVLAGGSPQNNIRTTFEGAPLQDLLRSLRVQPGGVDWKDVHFTGCDTTLTIGGGQNADGYAVSLCWEEAGKRIEARLSDGEWQGMSGVILATQPGGRHTKPTLRSVS